MSAERKHTQRNFVIGESPVFDDWTVEIIEGKEGLIAWAKEHCYKLDWKNQTLEFDEKKWAKKRRNGPKNDP